MLYKTQYHQEDSDQKKIDDYSQFNTFNFQSSAFFNHQLSSRSSDFTNGREMINELASDFLQMQLKTQSKKSTRTSVQRKSFDFSYDQNEILKKQKIPHCNSNNDFFKFHSNSANVHNYCNYVLKSEIKKNNSKYSSFLNASRPSDNPVLKYYGSNQAFFRTSSNITNGYGNNIDKNIYGLGDIDSNGIDESEHDSEDEDQKESGDNDYITTRTPAFNLNYLNNNGVTINTCKTFNKKSENVLNALDLELLPSNQIDSKNNEENSNKENIITPVPSIYQEVLSNAHSLIQDQSGCRFLQKKIDEDKQITDPLFDVLFYDIITMCTDSFGNYLVQKILDNMSHSNIEKFTQLITLKFSFIAISTYGTRVIQKLLEVLSNKVGESSLKKAFDSINSLIIANIIQLSSDSNSSHIIIKYVNVIKYPYNIPLFDSVCVNFLPLCKDKHGCCVIQKCIEAGNESQKEKLFSLSNSHCEELISDQFGNYVIQYVVLLNIDIINKYVVNVIMNNLLILCKEKYASNVIEKFLYNKSSYSKIVIDTIVKDESLLHELILDQYGNYIIQRILMIIFGDARMKVITMIVKWYDEIKMLSFGPRLIAKLSERYGEFNMLVGNRLSSNPYGGNSNIGNVNFIQLNNYMFPPSTETMGMYMKMMNPQQMYHHKMVSKHMNNTMNNQFCYPQFGNIYQQPQQFNNFYMKGNNNQMC